jgi:hypothetical protein
MMSTPTPTPGATPSGPALVTPIHDWTDAEVPMVTLPESIDFETPSDYSELKM